jgi:hypothetical protein
VITRDTTKKESLRARKFLRARACSPRCLRSVKTIRPDITSVDNIVDNAVDNAWTKASCVPARYVTLAAGNPSRAAQRVQSGCTTRAFAACSVQEAFALARRQEFGCDPRAK